MIQSTKQLDQLNKLGVTINGDIYCCIKTGKFCINTTFVMGSYYIPGVLCQCPRS